MNEERLLKILLAPYVTEKTSFAQADRQYAFKVLKDATKAEVKAAVSKLFNVQVTAVNILNVKPELRGGRRPGRKPGWKKAYVTLAQGQTINIEKTA